MRFRAFFYILFHIVTGAMLAGYICNGRWFPWGKGGDCLLRSAWVLTDDGLSGTFNGRSKYDFYRFIAGPIGCFGSNRPQLLGV